MSTEPPTWPPPPAAVTNNSPYQTYHPSIPPVQPGIPVYLPSEDNLKWSTGLCHCFDDPAICLITCICPCITFGQIADIVNRGTPTCAVSGALYGLLVGFTGFACLYSCFYRSRLRARFGLEEAPCADCLVHFCCEACALCQEYRELRNRGFDMGLALASFQAVAGWEGNRERNSQRGRRQPPSMMGDMIR